MQEPIIEVRNLSKKYRLGDFGRHTFRERLDAGWSRLWKRSGNKPAQPATGRRINGFAANPEFWALRDVSFSIERGDVVGVIGRNGAGKSTLLKILSRITEPTSGDAILTGRVASLLEVGTGFHPDLTGRENIYLNGAILGMKKAEIRRRFDQIVAFAEIDDFIDTPVKRYSSGMYVRLAFAVAAHLEPEILILDEVLSVGDASFQKKCLGKMRDVSHRDGRTVVFVSHNLQAVRQLCRRAIVLSEGRLIFAGECHEAIGHYMRGGGGAHGSAVDLAKQPRVVDPHRARLLAVAFFDEQGRPALQISRWADLTVQLRLRVERPLAQPNIGMAIVHVEGQRVFSESYSDQIEAGPLPPGEYTLRFSIPMQFLKLESYFLALSIVERGTHCDLVEGVPLPELVDPNSDSTAESQRWGIVRIPVKWSAIEPAFQLESAVLPR